MYSVQKYIYVHSLWIQSRLEGNAPDLFSGSTGFEFRLRLLWLVFIVTSLTRMLGQYLKMRRNSFLSTSSHIFTSFKKRDSCTGTVREVATAAVCLLLYRIHATCNT
jgi:hypothetical protein